MTTDELNAIVQAVMTELEKAGVDFDFKAETPQPTDLVYVMRGTADKYQGITVKWQNLLDIIVKKATDAKDEAVSAKDIALQTLATIQGIESNVSSMKSSVDASEANVASMKASVETSESNVTQMKSDVSEMKTSVEGTKTEVEGLKSDVTALKAQTQNIVDNAEQQVTGLLDTKADVTYVDGELAKKVNYTDSLSYEQIMDSTDLTNKVASAEALKEIAKPDLLWTNASHTSAFDSQTISLDVSKYKYFLISVKNSINSNTETYMNVVLKNVRNRIIGVDTLGIVVRINTFVTESGIFFSNGYPINSESINNNYAIPYQIYGVK